jgi:hypothetical protein
MTLNECTTPRVGICSAIEKSHDPRREERRDLRVEADSAWNQRGRGLSQVLRSSRKD